MICLSCKSNKLINIYDFGLIPLVNSFHKNKSLSNAKFRLNLKCCSSCRVMQLVNTPKEALIFKNYKHISGASEDNLMHLKKFSSFIFSRYKNKKKILEIGCNDGSLLRFMHKKKFSCTGIDPAKNLKNFQPKNIKIICDFFNRKISKVLEKNSFDIIIGLNVFAHFKSVQNSFKLVHSLLKSNGVFIFEVAYAFDTILKSKFDTIYHEHVFNHTILGLKHMLNKANLKIESIKKINTQGGSLRITVRKGNYNSIENYRNLLKKEYEMKLHKNNTYKKIGELIKSKIKEINVIITASIDFNKKLLLVGAPARGVVFYNTTKIITHPDVYCIDDSKTKAGCFFPGGNFKIIHMSKFNKYSSEFSQAILLSWNYKKLMIKKLKSLKFKGKLYIFFPRYEIIKI
jgi:2-polyprenyl-3-methyl-5-hydroxy-6-metoxy-1,4-benzoquinol methylase